MVDLPTNYGVVLGHEWCFPLCGYIMNDESYMMLANRHDDFTMVSHDSKRPMYFKKNETLEMEFKHGTWNLCHFKIN